ncbi:tripartite tricarboxylate transporter substrate binding protein [Paracraurococcus lichenis]|uniref:Tripartite tricarboxylate transporter substrate binding protein n=1 Tax=Paracraurococcus lichenis TaxID=3064888 RepID=A0ABT9DX11_9PROT|nr:tripartite tricarboxylate transporter substrate binding protein [Paracraurococcus sp. LOR1-02]MDO9708437.1 tripartite tricarboxylate transporter substrate binding protein [Paracraurococcus sp. LOR1-02]
MADRGRTRRVLLAGLGGLGLARGAVAQGGYPDRPVRIIVPFAGGGGNDVLVRLYGQKLSERLGQPFVAENRPGAGGQVGTEQAIRSRPDGYTLVVNPSSPVLANPGSTEPAYDQTRDLAPIAVLATFPTFVLVAPGSPHRSLQDLLAWAKEEPGRATYGFGGLSFQFLAEQIAHRAGAKMQAVLYRGSQDAINAVSAGDLTMALTDPGPALAALDGKRVRALAVSTAQRWPRLPEVPTVAEQGFPGLGQANWIGLLAPAGTPEPILARLEAAVAEAARAPDVAERLRPMGMEPDGTGRAGFRAMIEADNRLWREVAKEAGISLSR